MITITEKAREKVAEILLAEGKANHGLRVAVHGGGCSGFQYALNFAEGGGAADETVDAGPFKIYVDPISAQYLEGAEIDYLDGLNGTGFKISNPQAKSTCGCGQSFGA
jgi:iron-sulfur cluster insertion protein